MKVFFIFLVGIFSFVIYPIFVFWFVKTHPAKWFDTIRDQFETPAGVNTYLAFGDSAANGIIFGFDKRSHKLAFSSANNEGHVFVVGGSGTGKTSALLIPTLRAWSGGAFVIDISGDISSNVHDSDKVIYFPGAADSQPYNVFGPIDVLHEKADQDEALAKLAFLLIPLNERLDGAARYFENGGRNILIAALTAFYHEGFDFIEICKKIALLSAEELFSEIAKAENDIANAYISGFRGEEPRNVAGCKNSCDSAIKLFATNAAVGMSIRRPRPLEDAFSPDLIENHKVFVVIPDEKLALYAPLLRIIVAQTLSYFAARPATANSNVLFCLDEFASLGKIDIVPALQKLRKRHVRIMVLTQSIADIDAVHGHDAHRSMMSNFTYRVILSAFDSDDQRYFGEMIGKSEQKQVSTSYNGNLLFASGQTVRYEKEYVVDPAELGRLGNELILLYPGGHVRLEKNFYFKKAVDKPSLKSKLQSMLKSW